MWCDACRSTGAIHCAMPDECGNMLSATAAADNWKAWLDDLPLPFTFDPAIGRLQDFITGLTARIEAQAGARADAQAAVALVVEQCAKGADRRYAAGDMGNPGHHIRALAPIDGLAILAELRAERDTLRALCEDRFNEIARLAAANAVLEAKVAGLVDGETRLSLLLNETASREAAKVTEMRNALMWARDRIDVDGGMTDAETARTAKELLKVLQGQPSPASAYAPEAWQSPTRAALATQEAGT